MTDLDRFIRDVRAMRAAQKLYFKTERGTAEKQAYMVASKDLERRVDAALADIEAEAAVGQTGMRF